MANKWRRQDWIYYSINPLRLGITCSFKNFSLCLLFSHPYMNMLNWKESMIDQFINVNNLPSVNVHENHNTLRLYPLLIISWSSVLSESKRWESKPKSLTVQYLAQIRGCQRKQEIPPGKLAGKPLLWHSCTVCWGLSQLGYTWSDVCYYSKPVCLT